MDVTDEDGKEILNYLDFIIQELDKVNQLIFNSLENTCT